MPRTTTSSGRDELTHSAERVRIRAARIDDVAGLVELEHRCFRIDLISARMLRRHATSPRAILLVAERGNELLGDALVFIRGDSRKARLYSIAVAAEARGLGLGAKLLQAAERAARARGATHMRLEVHHQNRAAVALYEGRGYRHFAVKHGFYEDGGTAWRYEKRL